MVGGPYCLCYPRQYFLDLGMPDIEPGGGKPEILSRMFLHWVLVHVSPLLLISLQSAGSPFSGKLHLLWRICPTLEKRSDDPGMGGGGACLLMTWPGYVALQCDPCFTSPTCAYRVQSLSSYIFLHISGHPEVPRHLRKTYENRIRNRKHTNRKSYLDETEMKGK